MRPFGLAEQLDILFDVIRTPSGKPHTMLEVCERTGINSGAMSRMRSGNVVNPTLNTLRALAGFFGIRLDYFECDSAEMCYAYLTELMTKKQGRSNLLNALKEEGISDKGVKHILGMISFVREMEGHAPTGS